MHDGVVGISNGGLGNNSELDVSCAHPLRCFHLFRGMRVVCGVGDGAGCFVLVLIDQMCVV